MKTIGMIGGMSWESTAVYYRVLNQEVQRRLGGVRSAQALLWSFDFGEIDVLQSSGRWDEATARMAEVARLLVGGGADFLTICCNTMHVMAEAVILGCTELPLLLTAEDAEIPLFDTAELHALAAADYSLSPVDCSLAPAERGGEG